MLVAFKEKWNENEMKTGLYIEKFEGIWYVAFILWLWIMIMAHSLEQNRKQPVALDIVKSLVVL
jgi:hypothetical protein